MSGPTEAGARSNGVRMVAATVDWVSATSVSHRPTGALATYSRHLVTREATLGNPRRTWAFFGYLGEASGRCEWGQRRDGTLVRVQSDLASEVWRCILDLASNISRIDLALTVWYAEPMGGLTDEYERAVQQRAKQVGRPITLGRWHSAKGGETLYIGSRSSERFARIYNKYAQSDSADYQNAWRYEVEFKGDAANTISRALACSTDPTSSIRDTVLDYFSRYGCHLPIEAGSLAVRDRHRMDTTTDAKRLRWLRQAVGPSVVDLASRVGYRSVLEALGIPTELLYNEPRDDPRNKKE